MHYTYKKLLNSTHIPVEGKGAMPPNEKYCMVLSPNRIIILEIYIKNMDFAPPNLLTGKFCSPPPRACPPVVYLLPTELSASRVPYIVPVKPTQVNIVLGRVRGAILQHCNCSKTFSRDCTYMHSQSVETHTKKYLKHIK